MHKWDFFARDLQGREPANGGVADVLFAPFGFVTLLPLCYAISEGASPRPPMLPNLLSLTRAVAVQVWRVMIEAAWCGALASLSLLLQRCADDATLDAVLRGNGAVARPFHPPPPPSRPFFRGARPELFPRPSHQVKPPVGC